LEEVPYLKDNATEFRRWTIRTNAVTYELNIDDARRFHPSKPEPHPPDVQRDRDFDDSDQAISAAFEDSPFASVPQLSRLTSLPSTTVYRSLTQLLEFVARHL
jgi:hypothetical protein